MAGNRPGGFSRGQGFAQREGRRGQAGQRGFANRSGMNARSFARKAPGQMRGREFGGKIQRPFANRQWQRRGNRPGQESMFPGPQMRPGRTGQRGLRGSAAPQNAARSTYGRRMENRSNMQRFRQAERRGPQVRRMKNDQSRAGARKPGGQQQMTGRKSTKNQSWRKKVMPSGQAGVAKKPVREAAPKQAPKSEMKKKAPEINPKPVQPKEAETQ